MIVRMTLTMFLPIEIQQFIIKVYLLASALSSSSTLVQNVFVSCTKMECWEFTFPRSLLTRNPLAAAMSQTGETLRNRCVRLARAYVKSQGRYRVFDALSFTRGILGPHFQTVFISLSFRVFYSLEANLQPSKVCFYLCDSFETNSLL